jgi:MoaA/NifB/PqqE/SkfB family radical SAM enzyme
VIRPGGIHFLLTYRCLLSCDHCFVWGDPSADSVFTMERLDEVMRQVSLVPSVEWIYFEGGEPFLYLPLLVHGVESAATLGNHVGIVSNGYWATSPEDAIEWLRPFAGLIEDLSVSTDLFHSEHRISEESQNALAAADVLGIPAGTIICESEDFHPVTAAKGDPVASGGIMYRGRAAVNLAHQAPARPWRLFNECPHERLDDPGRVHIDPVGEVHLCQGLSLGNVFEKPLPELFAQYEPSSHSVTSSLLGGGPAQLVRDFDVPHAEAYADACHLCYEARKMLRPQFPLVLTPGFMYGEVES